ncbi:hypothetical protein [Nocardia crassostreae]|uniref:hypothetical protein n=1 Tax=Nocardia crassostreae TaxID=53428 RepID=UPI00083430EF|nr:hypothetical protein [Nocardia crassostreae]
MRIRKFVATTLLTIAAIGIAAVTVHAEPVPAAPAPPAIGMYSGSENGIEYSTSVSADGRAVTTHLVNGRFDREHDGKVISVTAADGTLVERWPMLYETAGYAVRLETEVSPDGSTLTVYPSNDVLTPSDGQQLRDIGFIGAAAGLIVGVPIGVVLGCAVGLIFLIIGCLPGIFVGGVIGGGIGLVLGAIVI